MVTEKEIVTLAEIETRMGIDFSNFVTDGGDLYFPDNMVESIASGVEVMLCSLTMKEWGSSSPDWVKYAVLDGAEYLLALKLAELGLGNDPKSKEASLSELLMTKWGFKIKQYQDVNVSGVRSFAGWKRYSNLNWRGW